MSGLRAAILAGGSAQAVELALHEGSAAVLQLDAVSGELPLHAAARLGQAGSIRRLLRCGAQPDARTSEGQNRTALHVAAACGHIEAAAALLAAGASAASQDAHGRCAAHCAADAGHVALAEWLHTARRESGTYELGDLAHAAKAAVGGLGDAAGGLVGMLAGLSPFRESEREPGPSLGPVPAVNTPGPTPPAPRAKAPAPAPAPGAAPAPRAAPSARGPGAELEELGGRVEALAGHVGAGHLREAATWQDELTSAACALDCLDLVTGEARAKRRALLQRIDELSRLVDERLAASASVLEGCGLVLAELEPQVRMCTGLHPPEWRSQLRQLGSSLDALECASEQQRSRRRAQLALIEELESGMQRREPAEATP